MRKILVKIINWYLNTQKSKVGVFDKAHVESLETSRKALLDLKDRYASLRQIALNLIHDKEAYAKKIQVLVARLEACSDNDVIDDIGVDNLIKLCHPDKHGNSKLATVVTQKLLNFRDSE